jgi:hypothetical protein
MLVPTLHAGQVVFMANLSSHQGSGVKEAIESVGARRESLPPIAVHLRGFWPVDQLAATPELCVIPGSRNRACWRRTTQTALSGHV